MATGYQPQNLCEALFRSLANVILTELDHPHEIEVEEEKSTHIQPYEPLDEKDVEGPAHQKFAEGRLAFFVGRTKILQEIADYLESSDRRILAIVGGGGTGKSALMAKAIEQTQRTHPQAQIIYRFIGATPNSSDGRGLLQYLCRELSHRYGADEADIPIDYRELVPEFTKRMGLANADKPLILFLNSLDQLSTSQGARSLIWLPAELPEHVSLIVSTRDEEDTYQSLKNKSVIEKHLGGLEPEEGKSLLKQWLESPSVQRKLQTAQREEVLEKFAQSGCNPLYLKLAFEEARLWTSYQSQEELTVGVSGIIQDNMINRLKHEGKHGEMLVSHALGYLAASHYGLAEDELVDLLSRDLQVYDWFFRQSYHLPSDLLQLAVKHLQNHPEELKDMPGDSPQDAERLALGWLKQYRTPPEPVVRFLKDVLTRADGPRLPIVLWSRLSFDLAPYLTERNVDGSSLLSFYHRELGDVSKAAFLSAYLFDVTLDFADELDQGRVSNRLQDRFRQHKHTLTPQAQIKVDQPGIQWKINVGNDQFIIKSSREKKLAVFLVGANAQPYHEKLADYFKLKANPKRDQTWTGKNIHGLSELPYHLTEAGKYDDLFKTLTDFKFLEHKAEEVGITKREDENGRMQITSDGVHQLQQDFERAFEASPGVGAAGASRRAPLIITARKTGAGLTVYCPVCNKTSPIKEEMRGRVITCPQEGCQTPLKINPFVTDMR